MTKSQDTCYIDVRLSLSHQEIGLESLCDVLLAAPSTMARTRVFRELLSSAFRGILAPLPTPTQSDQTRWLTSTCRIVLNLRLRSDDPSMGGLHDKLLQFPDNRSRAAFIRKLLHDALHQRKGVPAPTTAAQQPAPQAEPQTPASALPTKPAKTHAESQPEFLPPAPQQMTAHPDPPEDNKTAAIHVQIQQPSPAPVLEHVTAPQQEALDSHEAKRRARRSLLAGFHT